MGTLPMRSRWADKFREPTLDALLSDLADKSGAPAFTTLRTNLLGQPGIEETVEWLGTPWQWTLVYRCDSDPTRALAYLIPDPSRPQVCVPLTHPMVQAIPLRRLKKGIREGINYSKMVAGTYWPTWALASAAATEDILDLITRKYKFVHAGQESLAGV